MSLVSGHTYFIKSKSSEGLFVGRSLREDMSLLPKSVLLLHDNQAAEWVITKVPDSDHVFTLRIRGAPTAVLNHRLFAILLPQPEATKWKIEAQPSEGKNVYTISVVDEPQGWVSPSPDEEDQQIKVRPLIILPSYPPKYPLNELFEIIPVDRD